MILSLFSFIVAYLLWSTFLFLFLSEGQQQLFPSRITLSLESASRGNSLAYRSRRLITLI